MVAPLGSIPELPALSCQEIKLSEGKNSISKKYWLDPTNVGSSKLVYCDMNLGGKSVYQEQNYFTQCLDLVLMFSFDQFPIRYR